MNENEIKLEIAKTSSIISISCAVALAELGLFNASMSEAIEKQIRTIAQMYGSLGGDIAETRFDALADRLAECRTLYPYPPQ
jgi:hypothetical protein